MRHIQKGKEPKEWTDYRLTPGVSFESKDSLKRAILKEQGHLCAYCMNRISFDSMRIEHMACRDLHTKLKLTYNNLLGCCCGNTQGEKHCDQSKDTTRGQKPVHHVLRLSPLRKECIDSLSYTSKGLIKSSNKEWDDDLNEALQLNIDALKENRHKTLEAVVRCLSKSPTNIRAKVNSLLREWKTTDGEGKLKPYCGIVIYYLEKKQKRPL